MARDEPQAGRWLHVDGRVRYQVIGELGAGSTGIVYLARQPELGRQVAIKQLSPDLARHPDFLERFRREARVMAQLDHSNCVRVYDFFEQDGAAYLVDEYVEGASLRQVLKKSGRLTPEQALGVLKGALAGLAYAHSLGLVHRDVKPENVLVDQQGTSKLADFGLAIPWQEAPTGGSVEGSPAYMSPEQLRGEAVDARSDLYSCGVMLFELLTGRPPYQATDLAGLRRQHLGAPVPNPAEAEPSLPGPVAGMVMRSLAKERQARPQTAEEFLQELEQAAQAGYGQGWEKRASIAGAVGSLLAAAGGVGLAGGGGAATAGGVASGALASGALTTGAVTTSGGAVASGVGAVGGAGAAGATGTAGAGSGATGGPPAGGLLTGGVGKAVLIVGTVAAVVTAGGVSYAVVRHAMPTPTPPVAITPAPEASTPGFHTPPSNSPLASPTPSISTSPSPGVPSAQQAADELAANSGVACVSNGSRTLILASKVAAFWYLGGPCGEGGHFAFFAYVYKDDGGWHAHNWGGTQSQLVPGADFGEHAGYINLSSGCVNVRSGPSPTAPVVRCLASGSPFQTFGEPTYQGGHIWWRLRTGQFPPDVPTPANIIDLGWADHDLLLCGAYLPNGNKQPSFC